MAVQMLGIKTKFTDDQGRPLVGGKVHAYFAGTTTYQDTFKDPDMTIVNTNPIILDDSGSADVYLNGSYRIRIFDKNDVLIEEQDGVTQSVNGEITTAKGEIIGLYGAVLNSLTNEVKRAVAAEKTIADSLTSETTRAKSAESALQSSISDETTRAKAAESDLNTGLAKEVSDRKLEVTRLDEVDAVLQAQINSVGGGKLAYKTYAEMIADKSNIAAKSSIDIIADSDDKNGTYLYDGANFVKSNYNLEKLIRAKVQNTFGTYAQMVASNLSDGAYALVADDAVNSGFYKKTSGGWVKAEYNPKDSLDNLASVVPANTSDIVRIEDSAGQFVYKATNEGKHYFAGISNDLQSELEDKSVYNTANINSIFEFKDADGGVTFKQDADGDLFAPKVGNLTQEILSNKTNIGQVFDNYNHYSASDTLGVYTAGKYYDRKHIDFSKTTNEVGFIMTPQEIDGLGIYDYTVNVLRIPSMLRISKNQFLIGFESRFNWADVGQNSATTCIATVDEDTHAVTVSDVNNIGKYFVDQSGKWRGFMNPGFVQLDDNQTVIVFYLRRHKRLEHELYMRKSTDNGKTWGEAVDISHIYKETKDWGFLIGNSNGFVHKYGPNKGRIVLPSFFTNARYTSDFLKVNYIYSDDNGDTWNVGETIPYNLLSEAQFIEDFNGDMLISARCEQVSGEGGRIARYFARYVAATKEYIRLPVPSSLDTEHAQGGLARGETKFDDTTAKVVISVNTYGVRHKPERQQRTGLTVGVSYDAMQSWITYNVPELDESWTGYNNIDFLDENHLFCIYEGDNTTIKYAIIPLANVLQQGVR